MTFWPESHWILIPTPPFPEITFLVALLDPPIVTE